MHEHAHESRNKEERADLIRLKQSGSLTLIQLCSDIFSLETV